jgi:hypothetical protein
MKYAVEIRSGAMRFMPSFINTGLKICYLREHMEIERKVIS